MSRAARLLRLMELLRQRRAPVRGKELAESLGISLRTLYRDLESLREEGADIRGEPGVGYVLRPGFTLPPLMFSVDELEAVVLGARWVASRGDEGLKLAADDLMAKLRAVVPPSLRDHLEGAGLTVPPPSAGSAVDLGPLRAAMREEQKLVVTYLDASGLRTTRTVWPLAIGVFERVMILAAWCELRGDFRAFRVDRIIAVERTGAPLPAPRETLLQQWRVNRGLPAADTR